MRVQDDLRHVRLPAAAAPSAPRSRWRRRLAALLVAGLAASAPSVQGARSAAKDGRLAGLPEHHRQWLDDVELIIGKEERAAFLELEKDYQRDAFIRRFWEARDPNPATPRNEFKDRYLARLADAREEFDSERDERFRFYVLHGDPGEVIATDCGLLLWPIEIWNWGYSELVGGPLTALFYQPGGGGPFKLWRPVEGYAVLMGLGSTNAQGDFYATLHRNCTETYDYVQALLETIRAYEFDNQMGPVHGEEAPEPTDPEWLATFHAFSTDVAPSVEPLAAELVFDFPGRHQQRVIVRGRFEVSSDDAGVAELGDGSWSSFQLTGEVLREEELFDSFRYRFDLPRHGAGDAALPLVFERYLRPGLYGLVLKLEDLNDGGVLRLERELEVPSVADGAAAEEVAEAAGAAGGEAPEIGDEASVELVARETELQSGLRRFHADVIGEAVRKVSFLLDDRPVLTKTRPPYSVELDLGDLPVSHRVRAVAYDAAGAELATDELLLNAGEHTFIVRLVEPRRGERYEGELRARAVVEAPAGRKVERVELFHGDVRVATLYAPPWVHPIPLADDALGFVRAVAYLEDGNSTEDLVVFNSSQYIEDVEVQVVELFATVVDGQGRHLDDLSEEQFTVVDAGQPQSILRFERLEDLPIYASLLLDTSASMAPALDEVRRVALGYLEESVRPRDRACVITFSDAPRLAAEFTNDLTKLAGGLAGLSAERSTALYDSVMFALYYFKGIKGQKALIVLSDGEDRRSEATFEEALDFARSSGVTVYTIGFKMKKGGRSSRGKLERLATDTGGRSFFIEDVGELGGIYAAIQKDLRSRYLLVYQPQIEDPEAFRKVDVRVAVAGAEVRTLSGYYP